MSSSLNTSFSTSFDIVGIYDATNLQQVFANARPLKATVRETSRVMDHPVETGVIISDHHIINPKEINIPIVISKDYYASMYQQIKNAFINATLLCVQTRTDFYSNIIVADMPHEEDADMFDVVTLALHLKEVLYVAPNSIAAPTSPANYNPADPVKSNIVQSGQQSPIASTPTDTELYDESFAL